MKRVNSQDIMRIEHVAGMREISDHYCGQYGKQLNDHDLQFHRLD